MNPQLLAAVLAEPDDDSARLILADWLEENGEADQATFIRLGCQFPEWGMTTCAGKRQWISFGHRKFSFKQVRNLSALLRSRLPPFTTATLDANVRTWISWFRGFVDQYVGCAIWLVHNAELLLWSPKRKNSCLPTMHPIKHAVLRTWPLKVQKAIHELYIRNGNPYHATIAGLQKLAYLYPKTTFTLHPHPQEELVEYWTDFGRWVPRCRIVTPRTVTATTYWDP